MAAIKVENFLGIRPSVQRERLHDAEAVAAENTTTRFGDFRPVKSDTTIGSGLLIANPKTIYRFLRTAGGEFNSNPSTGWSVYLNEVDLVKGPIPTDTTERTYYTGDSYPKAMSLVDTVRKLGVPAPAGITASVNVTDELTPSELPGVDSTAIRAIKEAIDGAFVSSYQGNAIPPATPSVSQVGWAPHGAGMPSVAAHQWNFLVPMNGAVPAPGFEYLQRPEFGGMQILHSGVYYWAVPFELYAPVQTINSSTLSAALTALKQPNDATTALFESAEVTGVTADIVAYYALTSEPMKSLLDNALAATSMIRSVIDQSEDGIPAAFFSSTTWTDAFNAVVGINTTTEKGAAAERIAYQATIMATTNPLTGAAESISPTATRYWPETAGIATQYSNIRSDINSCISTNDLGQVEFDAGKLRNILAVEFEDIIIERTADQRPGLRAGLDNLIEYCIQPLVALFDPTRILELSRQASTDVGSALLAARDVAKTALNTLRNIYTDRVAQTEQAAKNSYAIGAQQRIIEVAVSRIVESRAYVATYVTDWGEESAPSTVSAVVDVDQNDSVDLTIATAPPGRNILKIRIYRSQAGSSTDSAFLFVKELTISTDGYTTNDALKSTELGETCPSFDWDEPPADLANLVLHPSGALAGSVRETVYFSEPNKPYAWPPYEVTVDFSVVGLCVFGQSIFVGTRGNPFILNGADPGSMSAVKLDANQACVSKRSIVSVGSGVIYASPDGLCMCDGTGVRLLTQEHFSRADWQAYVPSSIIAAEHDGTYFAFYNTGAAQGCLALDMATKQITHLAIAASAVHLDRVTDTLYIAQNTSIIALFVGSTYRTGRWRSKLFTLPAHAPMGWLAVDHDGTANITVRIFVDGGSTAWYTATIDSTNHAPVRLPSGRHRDWQIEVESTARINSVVIATAGDEIRATA